MRGARLRIEGRSRKRDGKAGLRLWGLKGGQVAAGAEAGEGRDVCSAKEGRLELELSPDR